MTGQRFDTESTEQAVRDWLAASAPTSAPASLRATLEQVTASPAGNARPVPRLVRFDPHLAVRFAVIAAVVLVVASSALLYGIGGPQGEPLEDGSPAASASAPASTASLASATSAPASTAQSTATPQPTVIEVPGSGWKLVTGALPREVTDTYQNFPRTVFALSTGGFVAFVSTTRETAGRLDPRVHAAAIASYPTSPPDADLVTRVFTSSDGLTWTERASLPDATAQVAGVVQRGGLTVAVGNTTIQGAIGEPIVWTTRDFSSWTATHLQSRMINGTLATGVCSGPHGLLAYGYSPESTELWASTDGIDWTWLPTGTLPNVYVDDMYALPDGYAILGDLSDRPAAWTSTDGRSWVLAWQGPGPQGNDYPAMGQVLPAPNGSGYLSFGSLAAVPGGAPAQPLDLILWTSPDLVHWTIAQRAKAPGWISGYAMGVGRYVAAGTEWNDPGLGDWGHVGVWSSPDGRSWTAISGLTALQSIRVQSVVGDGTHEVIECVDEHGDLQLLVGQ
jgi:hypothetical protein